MYTKNSKSVGYWTNNNIKLYMEEFTDDVFIDSFRVNKEYQKNILMVRVQCIHGVVDEKSWNLYKNQKCSINCKLCREDNYSRKWDSHLDFRDYFLKFGIEPLETPGETKESVYCITKEGFIAKVSISNLQRDERNKKEPSFDIFGKTNKYQFNNLKKWCEINRPDYQIVNYLYEDNISVKDELYIKYIGNNLKDKYCRYFKTTIDKFVHAKVLHPQINLSKGEIAIKDYLTKYKYNFIQQYSTDKCRNKVKLRFDFAVILNNKLHLIEFDGEQHYKDVKYFKNFSFEKLKDRDNIKNKFCEDNSIPLLRIRYKDLGKISIILDNYFHNVR